MTETIKSKPARRELIVNAAIDCFVQKGMHQTGMRDIAKAAGVSLGNLYNYFSGKDELIAEIAVLDGEVLDAFVAGLKTSEDPLSGIKQFVDDYFDFVSEAKNSFLTIDIIGESLRNPDVSEQFAASRSKLTDALGSTIARGISTEVFREDIDIDETVKLFLDTIDGLGLRCGLAQTTPSKKARKTLQDMMLRMLLP